MSLAMYRTVFLRSLFRTIRCLVLFAALLLSNSTSYAQDKQPQTKLQVGHRSPLAASLPLPGALMPISVELVNSRDIEAKVRIVGARDGRFMDVAFPLGVLNRQDHAEFTVSVPAPLASMTYQFIVHQPDGTLSTSAKYTIKRPCIQNFRVDISKDDPNAKVKQELAGLIARSKSLERETTNLEASLKILEGLSESLKQP